MSESKITEHKKICAECQNNTFETTREDQGRHLPTLTLIRCLKCDYIWIYLCHACESYNVAFSIDSSSAKKIYNCLKCQAHWTLC
jgi:hypothetical protein